MNRAHLLACISVAILCLHHPAPVSARPDAVEPVATDEASTSGFDSGSGAEANPRGTGLSTDKLDLGHTSPNPYKAMIDDLVAAPKAEKRGLDTPGSRDAKAPEQRSLFYDEDELKARVASVKSTVSSLLGDEGPKTQSEEERELGLQRDIAMRDAYRGARLAGGSGTGFANDNEAQRAAAAQDDTAKMRIMELGFLLWDFLTHPLTIALLVLYGLVRLVIAIIRVARDPHGRKSKGRRSGTRSGSAMKSQSVRSATPTDFETDQERRYRERRRRSRRHRSRRSFLDYFRST